MHVFPRNPNYFLRPIEFELRVAYCKFFYREEVEFPPLLTTYMLWLKVWMGSLRCEYFRSTLPVSSSVLNEFINTNGTSQP